MTMVQVLEHKGGKMQIVPKYKYGAIVSGKTANVIDNALVGLFTQSTGKKYLLHTHPDVVMPSEGKHYDPDHFSGLPYSPLKLGDASIPTLAGSKWYQLPQILNKTFTNIAGMGNPVTSQYCRYYRMRRDDVSLAAMTASIWRPRPGNCIYIKERKMNLEN